VAQVVPRPTENLLRVLLLLSGFSLALLHALLKQFHVGRPASPIVERVNGNFLDANTDDFREHKETSQGVAAGVLWISFLQPPPYRSGKNAAANVKSRG
jgi:hypothetical protein